MSFLGSLGIGLLNAIPGVGQILAPAEAQMAASGNEGVAQSNTGNAAGTITQNLGAGQTNLASIYNNYKDPATQAGVTAPQINPNQISPVTAPTMTSVYGPGGLGSVPGTQQPQTTSLNPYVVAMLKSLSQGGGASGGTATTTPGASSGAAASSSAPAAAPTAPTLTPQQQAAIASAAQTVANPQGMSDEQIANTFTNAMASSGLFNSTQIAQAKSAFGSGATNSTGIWGSAPGATQAWITNVTSALTQPTSGGAYNNNPVPSGGQQTGAVTSGYAPQGYAVNTPVATSQMAGITPNTVAPAPMQIGQSAPTTPGAASTPSVAGTPAYRQALAAAAGVSRQAMAA